MGVSICFLLLIHHNCFGSYIQPDSSAQRSETCHIQMRYPVPMGYVHLAFTAYIDKSLPAETRIQFRGTASADRSGQSGIGPRFRPRTSVFPSQHRFPTTPHSCIHLSLTHMILAIDSVVK